MSHSSNQFLSDLKSLADAADFLETGNYRLKSGSNERINQLPVELQTEEFAG